MKKNQSPYKQLVLTAAILITYFFTFLGYITEHATHHLGLFNVRHFLCNTGVLRLKLFTNQFHGIGTVSWFSSAFVANQLCYAQH